MIKKTIEGLRTKPDHHKRFVAFTASIAVTAVVFSIWFSTHHFFGSQDTTVIAQAKEKGPISIFSDTVASGFQAFKNTFK